MGIIILLILSIIFCAVAATYAILGFLYIALRLIYKITGKEAEVNKRLAAIELSKKADEMKKLAAAREAEQRARQEADHIENGLKSAYKRLKAEKFPKFDIQAYFKLIDGNESVISKLDEKYLHNLIRIEKYLQSLLRSTKESYSRWRKSSPRLRYTKEEFCEKYAVHPDEYYYSAAATSHRHYRTEQDIVREKEAYVLIFKHICCLELLAISMVFNLTKNNMASFYRQYEIFESLGVFNSTWERDVIEELQDIKLGLFKVSAQLGQLDRALNEVGLKLIKAAKANTKSIVDELNKVNGGIAFNNLMTAYNTYQTAQIKKGKRRGTPTVESS